MSAGLLPSAIFWVPACCVNSGCLQTAYRFPSHTVLLYSSSFLYLALSFLCAFLSAVPACIVLTPWVCLLAPCPIKVLFCPLSFRSGSFLRLLIPLLSRDSASVSCMAIVVREPVQSFKLASTSATTGRILACALRQHVHEWQYRMCMRPLSPCCRETTVCS